MKPQPWVLLAILVVFFATACASIQEESDAWSSFLAYRSALENGVEGIEFSSYLSARQNKELNDALKNADSKQLKEEIIDNSSFPLWLSKLSSHFQKDVPDGSCLTVNGVTSQNEPVTLDMRFVREDAVLKLAKTNFIYLEDISKYAVQARCPEETMVSFDTDSASTQQKSDAWSSFLAYRSALKNGIQDAVFYRHISARYYKALDDALKNAHSPQQNDAIIKGPLFPLWLSEMPSHFQKDIPGGSCLTVNGVASHNKPVTLNMRFVKEDFIQKLDYINIIYLEDSSGYAVQARCPEETTASF